MIELQGREATTRFPNLDRHVIDSTSTRNMRIYRRAQIDLLSQNKEELAVLEAYAAGVNTYLELLQSTSSALSMPLDLLALKIKKVEPWRYTHF